MEGWLTWVSLWSGTTTSMGTSLSTSSTNWNEHNLIESRHWNCRHTTTNIQFIRGAWRVLCYGELSDHRLGGFVELRWLGHWILYCFREILLEMVQYKIILGNVNGGYKHALVLKNPFFYCNIYAWTVAFTYFRVIFIQSGK